MYASTGKLLNAAYLAMSHLPSTVIPLATICYHTKKLSADNLSKSLTTAIMRALIADTIKFCDEAQNGMTRKEVIQLLVQLTGGSAKSCKNHYD